MVRLYETAVIELEDAKAELAEIEAMSEAEACCSYNVDSKSEIETMLREEIEALEEEVEYLTPTVYEYEY